MMGRLEDGMDRERFLIAAESAFGQTLSSRDIDWEYAENVLPYIENSKSFAEAEDFLTRPVRLVSEESLSERRYRTAIFEHNPEYRPAEMAMAKIQDYLNYLESI